MFSSNQGHIYDGELSRSVRENKLSHLTPLLISFVMGGRSDGQLLSFL